jgi:hypothetical protein
VAVRIDADQPFASWRGCTVYAIGIDRHEDDLDGDDLGQVDPTVPPGRLLLDLDYVVDRVPPDAPGRSFRFRVAPATLAFDQAWDVTATLGPVGVNLVLTDLRRHDPPDRHPDPLWHLAGDAFDIWVRAAGYRLYLRTPPACGPRALGLARRGGISFAERAYA